MSETEGKIGQQTDRRKPWRAVLDGLAFLAPGGTSVATWGSSEPPIHIMSYEEASRADRQAFIADGQALHGNWTQVGEALRTGLGSPDRQQRQPDREAPREMPRRATLFSLRRKS